VGGKNQFAWREASFARKLMQEKGFAVDNKVNHQEYQCLNDIDERGFGGDTLF